MEITRELLEQLRQAERQERDAALAKANAAIGRLELINQLLAHLEAQPEPKK